MNSVYKKLCVSGDTPIMTDNGYFSIKMLSESVPPVHNVWNGEKFTPATFQCTGRNKNVIKVDTAHGYNVKCTPYHEFIVIVNNVEKRVLAKDLKIGDMIQYTNLACTDIAHQYNTISNVITLDNLEDVYSFDEPALHRGVFNGLLLGS